MTITWLAQTMVAMGAAWVVGWGIFGYVESKGEWTLVLGAGLIAGSVTAAIVIALNRAGKLGGKLEA